METNPLLALLLSLGQLAITEVGQFTKKGNLSAELNLSSDMIAVIRATLAQHSANVGKPIEDVLAEL